MRWRSSSQPLVLALVLSISIVLEVTAVQRAGNLSKPNLLLLFPDQWRYDWDGLTKPGGKELPLKMPTLKKVASDGVRFTQAYVPAPVCAPSRACLASGREYDRARVPDNTYDYPAVDQQPTIYGLLRNAGYHTMVVGKDDLLKGSLIGYKTRYPGCATCKDGDGLYRQSELGFDDGFRAGGKMNVMSMAKPFEMYGFHLRNTTVVSKSGRTQTAWEAHRACFGKHKAGDCDSNTYFAKLYEDDWTAENAIKVLQRRPRDRPFFLQVNFPGPHDPFVVTGKMHDSVSDGRVWPEAADNAKNSTPGGSCIATGEPSSDRSRCNYAAELENLDALFARILAEVEAQGEMKRTVVMISSDHGEMLGDHSDIEKSKPWQGALSVPLIIAGPGMPSGTVVHRPVATFDLGGTLLEYAGVEPAADMTTMSLRSLLPDSSAKGYRTFISSGLLNFRVVVKEVEGVSYKYICCKGECPGAPSTAPPVAASGWMDMLISVNEDPFDMNDLSKQLPNVVRELRRHLPVDAFRGLDYASGCATIGAEELWTV